MSRNPRALRGRSVSERGVAFAAWFGSSQVVDQLGDPLVVYHGTRNDFSRFVPSDVGAFGAGIYFGGPEDANAYADPQSVFSDGEVLPGQVMPVYLSMQSPLVVDVDPGKGIGRSFLDALPLPGVAAMFDAESDFDVEITSQIKSMGFDGIIVNYPDGQEFVAFDPSQVKSVFNEAPTGGPDILMSAVARPNFYSQLAVSVGGAPRRLDGQSGRQWLGWLQSNAGKMGIKAEEMQWSGVLEWLSLQGDERLAKADLQAFLAGNGVTVSDTVLKRYPEGRIFGVAEVDGEGEDDGYWVTNPDGSREVAGPYESYQVAEAEAERLTDQERRETGARYEEWTLAGGSNYRELLITLPLKPGPPASFAVDGGAGGVRKRLNVFKTEPIARDFMERNIAFFGDMEIVPLGNVNEAAAFRSKHWPGASNVLVHVRMKDRVDASGQKVLFIEEIQSDWGQTGRREGFARDIVSGLFSGDVFLKSFDREADAQEFAKKFDGVSIRPMPRGSGVQPGPFVDKTQAWLGLALKRVALLAAEGGYDAVAFVSGAQSARRYELRVKAEQVSYRAHGDGTYTVFVPTNEQTRRVAAGDLEGLYGAEIADQIVGGRGELWPSGAYLEGMKRIDAPGLELGGEGMVVFYDEILPQAMAKLLAKSGGGAMCDIDFGPVVEGCLGVYDGDVLLFATDKEPEAKEYARVYAGDAVVRPTPLGGKQRGFAVSPAMRQVLAEGLPLFSLASAARPRLGRWGAGAEFVPLGAGHQYRSECPVVVEVLHGTTKAGFSVFSREMANPRGDFGAGFYGSNTPADVSANYASLDGTDLMQKVERMTREVVADADAGHEEVLREVRDVLGIDDGEVVFGDEIDEAAAIVARRRLSDEAPNVMKLFMRFERPAVMGGTGETFFDYCAGGLLFGERLEASGRLVEFMRALDRVGSEMSIASNDIELLKMRLENAARGYGLRFEQLQREMGNWAFDDAVSQKTFNFFVETRVIGEFLRKTLEAAGYDGVVDTTVNGKFGRERLIDGEVLDRAGGMSGLTKRSVHFVAFYPTQIKSATGNSGRYDGSSPDICMSRAPRERGR